MGTLLYSCGEYIFYNLSGMQFDPMNPKTLKWIYPLASNSRNLYEENNEMCLKFSIALFIILKNWKSEFSTWEIQ